MHSENEITYIFVEKHILTMGIFSGKGVRVNSSILVYHFKQHALLFCSTWMTSCMHLEKREG